MQLGISPTGGSRERHPQDLPGQCVLLVRVHPCHEGQTPADSAAIRATALDYIDGWYSNNPTRMERALHPHLAKRLVWADSTGKSHLIDLTALELIQGTRSTLPRRALSVGTM